MKTIVCLILILYITNVYSFEIKPTCVDSDLCDKIEKEINVVNCWISDKYHNKIELECSSPFKEDSDYKVKEYKFVKNKIDSFAIEYHFTPSLNYGKYMSKQAVEECEKKSNIQLPASSNPPSWTNTSCHTYFYHLKSEHKINECHKAWKAWYQMTTKGYLTEEHRNGNFLEMVKKQFHDNLVAVHAYAFEFQFDELSHNLLCIPEDDDEPLCHSLFKLCHDEDQEKGEHQWKDIKPNGIHTVPGREWYYQEPSDIFGSDPVHVQSTSDVKENQEETKYTKRGINLSPHWTDFEEDNQNDGRIIRCSKNCEEEKEKIKALDWRELKENGIHTTNPYNYIDQTYEECVEDLKQNHHQTDKTHYKNMRGVDTLPHWKYGPDYDLYSTLSLQPPQEEGKSACDDYCNEKSPHPEARLLCAAFCDSTLPLQPPQEEKKSISEPSKPQEQSTTDSVCLGGLCSAYEVRRADPSHTCYHADFCSGSEDCHVNGKHEQQKEKSSNDDHPGFLKAADGTIGNYCKFEYPSYQPLSCWNVSHATPGQGHDVWSVGDIFSSKTPSHNDLKFDFFYLIMFSISVVISGFIIKFFFSSFNYLVSLSIRIYYFILFIAYVIVNRLRYSYNEIRLFMNYVHDYIFGNYHTYHYMYEHRISQLSDLINDILTQQTEFESSTPDKETK